MSCTCTCHDRYRLLAYEHSADLQCEVNRLLTDGWKLHGTTFTFNGGYRQAMVRDVDTRYWLLPHQSPPVNR